MRRVLGFTSIRSDYDLLSGVFRRLQEDPEIDFSLLVSGAHLSPTYGHTIDLIRADGIRILGDVETLINGDTKTSRLKTASNLLSGSIDLVRTYNPDVMIFAGDREDAIIVAIIGSFLHIPTVHFFGGDHASDGHVDNPVRHAISKLATVHFVSIEEHAMRLRRLGEDPRRIYVIGSVALDKFVSEPLLSKEETLVNIGAKPHAMQGGPLAILIFHPLDKERTTGRIFVRNAVQCLIGRGYHVFIGAPNSDPGNAELRDEISGLAVLPEVTYYGNLPRGLFVNLMRHAAVMVGNSSAGILEAAAVRLPVINIGERQRGRVCASNVLFCDGGSLSFAAALSQIESRKFREKLRKLNNPYGDGNSQARAVELIKRIDFSAFVEKSEDPLYV